MAAEGKGLVIVTGASSGIGMAVAKSFSDAGHPLLLLARRKEPMEALELPRTTIASVDVSNLASFTAAVEAAEKEYGPTACLVNNAGCMLLGDIATQDPSEWTTMINVNVLGVLNGMRSVIGGMKERGAGTIINISSIAGYKVFPNHAVYCATKFGVHAITESVRTEVAETGVRVIVVSPGVVETPLLSHTTDEKIKDDYKAWKADGLKSKPCLPEDVAKVCQFAFDMPAHVTLREIVVGPTFQTA